MAYYSRKRPVVKGEKGGSAGPGKIPRFGKTLTAYRLNSASHNNLIKSRAGGMILLSH